MLRVLNLARSSLDKGADISFRRSLQAEHAHAHERDARYGWVVSRVPQTRVPFTHHSHHGETGKGSARAQRDKTRACHTYCNAQATHLDGAEKWALRLFLRDEVALENFILVRLQDKKGHDRWARGRVSGSEQV